MSIIYMLKFFKEFRDVCWILKIFEIIFLKKGLIDRFQ